jgi:hypothetical protein
VRVAPLKARTQTRHYLTSIWSQVCFNCMTLVVYL